MKYHSYEMPLLLKRKFIYRKVHPETEVVFQLAILLNHTSLAP